MIPLRLIAIPEYGIVEQIRESRERTIESGLPGRPPVGMVPNQVEIFRPGAPYAWIVENQAFVIEYESAVKRIRIGEQRERAQRKNG